jgi:hypothetical protein
MEVIRRSPFGKFRYKKYVILEALQFSGRMPKAIQWLYELNKETRAFLSKEYLMIERGYEVEGIVEILTLEIS